MSRRRRLGMGLGALALILLALAVPAARHLEAAGLLLRFEAPGEAPEGLARLGYHEIDVAPAEFELNGARVPARIYSPRDVERAPGIVLVHGVHELGYDEPRLIEFARVLSSAGLAVLTPHVREMADYRVERASLDTIAASARELAARLERSAVGVVGISFGGGLALLASIDQPAGSAIGFVVAVGAHHDLRRVARWYVGGECTGPDGEAPPVSAHPYGAGVLIRRGLDRFFPAEDLVVAEALMDLLLRGRGAAARGGLGDLGPEGRAVMERVFERQRDPLLRARYLEVMEEADAELLAISPASRIDEVAVPVFLLHGLEDPVIPSTETAWLERELPEGTVEGALVTPFLRHAEQEAEPTAGQRWELVHLMAGVLHQARVTERGPRLLAPPGGHE